MNYIDACMAALVYRKRNRLKRAWLMARASYAYTRAHDGMVVNDAGDRISFSRWYAFTGAVACGWRNLHRD